MIWVIVGVVWALRCLYRLYFPNLYTDTLLLWETAENFERLGKMIHSPIAGVHEGSSLVPLTVMPRGYVYLLWIGNQVFPTSQWSTLVIDGLSIGLWIGASLLILKRFEYTFPLSTYLFLLYLVLTPTLLHPLPATDLVCLALLSSCIAILGREPLAYPPWRILLASLLLAICGEIRYAYLPFMWLFPAVLFVYAYWKKRSKQIWPTFLYLLSFPTLFSLYSLLYPDPLPFLSDRGNTLFWHHLSHIDLFPLKALFYFNSSHISWLADFSHLPEMLWSILGICSSLAIIFLVGRTWGKWWKKEEEWGSLLFLGILLVNVGSLVYLSLTTPPETDWLPFWTFVMETRYYAPSQYIMVLSLLYLASNSYRIWTESQGR